MKPIARLLQAHATQRFAARLLGAYLSLALRSTRWQIEGLSNLAPYMAEGRVIVAVWHERLPLMPALWVRAMRVNPERRLWALASRHRDGRFIGQILDRFGIRMAYGSTGGSKDGVARDRGGAAAMRILLGALREGDAVVITPDGPRGPRRVAAPGVAQLAAFSQAPVVAIAGQVRHRVVLRSWDRMVLPLPFGRGAIFCGAPIFVGSDDAASVLPAISAALSAAAERADGLCGR